MLRTGALGFDPQAFGDGLKLKLLPSLSPDVGGREVEKAICSDFPSRCP